MLAVWIIAVLAVFGVIAWLVVRALNRVKPDKPDELVFSDWYRNELIDQLPKLKPGWAWETWEVEETPGVWELHARLLKLSVSPADGGVDEPRGWTSIELKRKRVYQALPLANELDSFAVRDFIDRTGRIVKRADAAREPEKQNYRIVM